MKVKKQKEWHSPQCKRRSKTRMAGCWCHLISKWQRQLLDAEEENR